jgi:signal transduction histidine kinase
MPLTADLALAVGLFVLGVLEAVFGFRDGGVGKPMSGPLAAEVLVVAGLTLPLACGPPSRLARRRRAWDSAGAVAVTSVAVPAMQAPGEILFSAAVIGGVWLAGRYAGGRQRRADQMTSYAALLEGEQDRLAQEALAGERARIARELHDIVAHSVSVMGVQAGAARLSMDTDADRARQVLISIEETAREAVAELRRLLGVLRADNQPPELAPQPGLADLPGLLAQSQQAGVAVTVTIEGDPVSLPAGVDLAAYRIVQEALTNTRKHAAPCTASVRIAYAAVRLPVWIPADVRQAAQIMAVMFPSTELLGFPELVQVSVLGQQPGGVRTVVTHQGLAGPATLLGQLGQPPGVGLVGPAQLLGELSGHHQFARR